MPGREFDFIVYGATGFTGERVVSELARLSCESERPYTYALAGRSEERLRKVQEKLCRQWNSSAPEVSASIKNAPLLVASVQEKEALDRVVASCSVLLQCAGPFRFLGEPVVRSCAENGTDYVDITGEPQFMETMALKYTEEAQKSGAIIVHACGFDSIPADMGVLFCQREFRKLHPQGALASVASGLSIKSGPQGTVAHYATYECAVHGFGDQAALKRTRQQLAARAERQPRIQRVGRAPRFKSGPGFNPWIGSYTVPFPGADASVVRNSQQLLTYAQKEGAELMPYYQTYLSLPGLWATTKLAFYGTIFSTLAKWGWGRRLLLAYPGLFTNGTFTHEGPSEEQMAATVAKFVFKCKGTTDKGAVETGNGKGRSEAEMTCEFEMPEPGYVATPIFIAEAARALRFQKDSIRASGIQGGVLTPTAAFASTDLLDRLVAHKDIRLVVV